MAIVSGLLAASGEAVSDWVKPAARFANFQATSAAATDKGTKKSKGEETKFDQLLAVMATQSAQNEQGLAQMREAQAQTQQAQSQIMQMMGLVFAGQEQQRLTNGWVAKSMQAISASSGCAIEAAPAPQEIVALPPAPVRMVTQTAPGGAPLVDRMVTEATSATATAGAVAPAAATSGGGRCVAPCASEQAEHQATQRGCGLVDRGGVSERLRHPSSQEDWPATESRSNTGA